MPKFEKKYVHFMWDDELKGKQCFVGDNIDSLKRAVEEEHPNVFANVSESTAVNAPFGARSCFWRFAYYDPYYELKRAHEQGKTIQFRNYSGEWMDWYGCEFLAWLEYRIKPDEPNRTVTNRELAHWLVQGNGELFFPEVERCCTNFNYDDDKRNEPVDTRFLVRRWDDEEWQEPSREYMGLEED